jgi:ankyrin repeat protein
MPNLDGCNMWSSTPLVYAVMFGRTECAKLLIQAEADVNICDLDQRSPLHHAARNNQRECARMLIRKGADMDVQDSRGITPLMDAITVNAGTIVQHLIQGGCSVDSVCEGTVSGKRKQCTPFQAAMARGFIECAKMLYLAGCTVGPEDETYNAKIEALKGEPAVKAWLEKVYSCPRKLMDWSRISIRKTLRTQAVTNAMQLPLPQNLKPYAAYYDLALILNP